MTKLEELSELLVSEIKEFEEAVKKLEEIRKSKIQLDLQNLQKLLFEHRQHVDHSLRQNERNLQMMEEAYNQTKIYFKRLQFLVAANILLSAVFWILLFYFFHPK